MAPYIPIGFVDDSAPAISATNLNKMDNAIELHDQEIDTLETDKANDNAVVKLTGNQTVGGIKAFSSSPIIPAPTTDLQAATKKYVDDNAGGASVWADVKSFGAVGDGVTDDTAAILAAIATGKTVSLENSNDTYLITAPLTLGVGQHLVGSGATLKTTANISMVILSSDSIVWGVTFLGNNTGTLQRGTFIDGGVSFNGVSRSKVIGCYYKNLGGAGYYVTRIVDAHQGNALADSTITSCLYGVHIDERGEYQTVSGCNIDSCTDGIRIIGGNSVISGSVISDCTNNIYLGAGGNDAHGLVVGCALNHGTYAVFANDPVSAFVFDGCNIYANSLLLNKTSRFKFNGCTFGSMIAFYFQGSVDDVFDCCSFVTSMPTFNHNYLGEPSKTHFTNCDYGSLTSGRSQGDINGGYLEVIQATSDINLLASTGEQIVPFNTVSFNALTNNLTYTYETFFTGGNTFAIAGKVKSPNKNFFADVDIAVSIGVASGAVDYSKINVYLKDLSASATVSKYAAILTPLPFENGVNPGLSWKVYAFKGRVIKSDYQLIVENNSGVALVVSFHQGTDKPCKARITNF